MSITTEKLYQLLPAFHRLRDVAEGEPLKALMAVIAEQADVMDADIANLYENWFIETCDEWVVPYIGDLLGVRGLHSLKDTGIFSQRAYVANTLSYRRRKGTAPVLEQLAFDTTGWRARVVEFFELLGTTQYINHLRPHNKRTPDLRQSASLELVDGPFDTVAHTVDVRRISSTRGNHGDHNIPNIGLYLWRLQSYPMTRSSARPAQGAPLGCYTFSPLGKDSQLFNRPRTETEITHLAEEINVPGLLRRRPLYDELDSRRQAEVEGKTPGYIYFDDSAGSTHPPVLEVFLNGNTTPVPPGEILVCNLEPWHLPPASKTYRKLKADGTYENVPHAVTAAVDPVLGRLSVANPASAGQVQVSYAYGFSGDVGGGPYNRRESIDTVLERGKENERTVTWQVGVGKELPPKADVIYDNLSEAVKAWNQQPPGTVGVIAVMDNHTYEEQLTNTKRIKVPGGSLLLLTAADWPQTPVTGGLPGQMQRVKGQLTPERRRPHLKGNIDVKGTAPGTGSNGGTLIVDGLLVEGRVRVREGNLGRLRFSNCTLAPWLQGLDVNKQNEKLTIEMARCICGPVKIVPAIGKLRVEESIVDGNIAAPDCPVQLTACTLLGTLYARGIDAGNCIFNGLVTAVRRQTGCVRFSYVSLDSKTPRRFRCQPDLEIGTQITEKEEQQTTPLSDAKKDAIRDRVLEWLNPGFTSVTYGHHAYAQLSLTCPGEIKTGADDGSEQGVFSILKQPQREANLRTSLDEYLNFGLEAGIRYIT